MAQNLTTAYLEIAQRITDHRPDIKWVDLWHNQVGFLQEEHNFETPAVFLAFRILGDPQDIGEGVQQAKYQIDMYYFYETFLDTGQDSINRNDALVYLEEINALYALFHGYSGTAFSEMRRIGLRPVDTGTAGNLYVQSFECILHDEAAKKLYNLGKTKGLQINRGVPAQNPPGTDFIIP